MQWQLDRDLRSLPRPGAGRTDCSFVEFYERPGDRQTEAQAAEPGRGGVSFLLEGAEDPGQLRRVDAHAVVRHP